MLPIPKELQGQKAIPFMEWCIKNAVLTLVTQNGQTRENYFEIPEYFLNFFNQPFTPEMLTEYFGNIDVEQSNQGYFIISKKDLFIDDNVFDDIHSDYQFYPPKTINDLTTLCTLAGVNLTWKGTK